ncbi:MAG: ribonuclease [Bacillales bacterium]|jgi:ribonuclease Z|nr:ribonuclease [Bacillales bacterium]
MELIFLGTGAGVPSKGRNVSSFALQMFNKNNSTWLFDCGEATQHRILYTNIKPRKIDKIFISHLHGDHIFGIPGLLGSRSFQDGTTPITIYGPKGIKDFVNVSLQISETKLKYDLIIEEFDNDGKIFEDDNYTVHVKKLVHGVSSFGFRVEEKDVPGELLVNELKQIGIKPGPLYSKIKNGEIITLENGEIIDGKNFVGPNKKGRIITYIGDTKVCEQIVELATDCDVLIHECTFSAADEKQASEYYHCTSAQAATSAKLSNAKVLLLTHISSRYQGEMCNQLVNEAREIFENSFITSDFFTFIVDR